MCGFNNVSNEPPCSDVLCPWICKIWQSPNIEIHCVMPLYMEVVISASNLKVWMGKLCLLLANNINYFRCDYKMCYFTCVEGFTFWSVIVGSPRWLDMEGLCAQLCTMSFSQCGWPNGPILSHGSNWPMMYVVWASFKNRHYVDLKQVFLKLT